MNTSYRVTVDLLDNNARITGTDVNTFVTEDRTDAAEAAIEFALLSTDAVDAVIRLIEAVE